MANRVCHCLLSARTCASLSSPCSSIFGQFPVFHRNLQSLPNRVVSGGIRALSRRMEEQDAKGSGTTARGRRLLKVREEKRRREHERRNNYPAWAKILEDACRDDVELRAVLGDSVGDPELMKKRVEERVRKKGRDFRKSKTGSVLAVKVSFRDFNPLDSYIWLELYGAPSDRDVDLIGSVIQAWYVMGRLGAFNSSNLQLANSSMDYNPFYDSEKGAKAMASSFHDISNIEFQDNWCRLWVDLGTCDFFAVDVLLNCLTALSSEYLGIQQVVFGGKRMGDWEEGLCIRNLEQKSSRKTGLQHLRKFLPCWALEKVIQPHEVTVPFSKVICCSGGHRSTTIQVKYNNITVSF